MSLEKTILITGATGKIGQHFVKHFAQEGYQIICTTRNQENIEKLSADVNPDRVLGLEVDLEQEGAIDQIIKFLEDNDIWPECLINNARNQDYLKCENLGPSRSAWLGEYSLDVVIPYELSMRLAHHKDSKLKNIINISSMYGVVAANPTLYDNPNVESPIQYSVAKAALIHLTKELAVRLSAQGVRVNAISYGGVEGRVPDEFKAKYAKLSVQGRMLKESEVLGAANYLVSEQSSAMTGHNLIVDGGWTVW